MDGPAVSVCASNGVAGVATRHASLPRYRPVRPLATVLAHSSRGNAQGSVNSTVTQELNALFTASANSTYSAASQDVSFQQQFEQARAARRPNTRSGGVKPKPVVFQLAHTAPVASDTPLRSLLSVTLRLLAAHEKRFIEQDHKKRQPKSRIQLSADYKRDASQTDGDKQLAGFRKALHSMGFVPSEDQVRFWDAFEQACMPWFYGNEWGANKHRVLKENGIKAIRPEVLVMTPRRRGKTWSICAFVLAMLLNRPGIRIAVFSTGRRASSAIMEICLKFMEKITGSANRVCKRNGEQLFIAASPLPTGCSVNSQAASDAQTRSTTSKLNAYPSAVDGQLQTQQLFVTLSHILHRLGFSRRQDSLCRQAIQSGEQNW